MKNEVRFYHQLLIFVATISALLGLIAMKTHGPLVVDGILYIKTAKIFLEQGYTAAAKTYSWPFFSIGVALLSKATSLPLEYAADLINLIFQVMIATTFVALVRALGGERLQLYCAAIIILTYPYFNGIRAYLTRDFGFWAFALMGLFFLIHYARSPRWRYAIAWVVAMAVATLFRIEGAGLLCFGSLALLFNPHHTHFRTRIFYYLKANILALLLGVVVIAYLIHKPEAALRLVEFKQAILIGLQKAIIHINESAEMLAKAILNTEAADGARILLLGGLATLFLVGIVKVLGVLYSFFVLHGMIGLNMPGDRAAKNIVINFLLVMFITLLFFLGTRFFVDRRYLVFLCLLLLFWAPFSVAAIFTRWKETRVGLLGKRWLLPLIVIIWVLAATGGIVKFGHSKAYLSDAGLWIKQNAPHDSALYSNAVEVLHYADTTHENWQKSLNTSATLDDIYQHRWHQYDYLAIRINAAQAAEKPRVLQELKQEPIQVFQNKRGDAVLIFKISNTP